MPDHLRALASRIGEIFVLDTGVERDAMLMLLSLTWHGLADREPRAGAPPT